MKTIIVQVPLNVHFPNSCKILNVLNGRFFEDKKELVSFLEKELKIDAVSENLLWESFEDFCNAINFDELNTEDYYYAACKIEK